MVKAKKRLGQHFLHDENVAKKVVDFFKPPREAFIFEIGFGTGVLTKYLLEYPNARFLDIDKESYDYIKEKYPQHSSKFLLQDFLKLDLSESEQPVYLIGNLPYNISSQIFFRIFENHDKIPCAVFMVQKEVAQRLASDGGDKEYGILSVLLGVYYDVKILFDVSRGAFNPPPKVTSSVIKLERNETLSLPVDDNFFKTLVKTVFGKRRKMLRNTLKEIVSGDIPECANVYLNLRPEQLNVNDFVKLAECLKA